MQDGRRQDHEQRKRIHRKGNSLDVQPEQPTGTVIGGKELLNIAAESKDDIFVIDQSYEHYTTLKLISDREAADAGNIILMHSMTKQFCIPGLRLGYVTAAPQLISRLKALRHPWSVNALAIEAGLTSYRTKRRRYLMSAACSTRRRD